MAEIKKRKLLGEMLIASGVITPDQLKSALESQKKSGLRLGKELIRLGYLTEEVIIETLGDQAGIPYVDLDTYLIDQKTISLLPEDLARRHQLIPLFKIRNVLTIAMTDPLNLFAIDEAKLKAGCEIEAVISTEEKLNRALDQCYGISGSLEDVVREISGKEVKAVSERAGEVKITEDEKEAPIIRLLNLVILQGVREKASDIHIEPEEKNLRIRYRIDGILLETSSPPKYLQPTIISRIKVLGNMDIAETRSPQDGRFKMKVDGKEIEFRVSCFPTIYGENVVLRILDQSSAILRLQDLGFAKETLDKYQEAVSTPYGIVLVTGPTGSGKTTTLYATLNTINSTEKNIITIEDPVEYRLNLIRQTQVNPKAGITFANGMRSIIRQDPDVIMVGEIRDLETSEIAFQAAMTGHLVFSTLHTNDAVGALSRMLQLGVEPFLIGSSTIGVLAQRLVRTVCPNCKVAYVPHERTLRSFNLSEKKGESVFYHGKGCKSCRQTGYHGRSGIFELMLVDDAVRELILRRASAAELLESARATQNMKTLREDGLEKSMKGITTLEEVNRVCF
ncbi:MAG TPA: ATPase, T2SS/T4P/T4SS family [Thermodesulfobacteriota bacterium]|nr:ATPase, T2SS/T4P/T4SS family [Thermodesulfobacteriota bacterium]